MTKTHVVVVGASGETGGTIVEALLESPETFRLTALARPSSVGKKEYVQLVEKGVAVIPADLDTVSDELVSLLTGVDVVISCMLVSNLSDHINLATAAKAAGVGRFVPSFFGPVCPPRGIMAMRDTKEDVFDCIKNLSLPFTIIDVGWWFQISLPRLPSGKIDSALVMPIDTITGDGNTPIALTDKRDIGKYVADIIVDKRTLNKSVFVYNELWTQNGVFDLMEELSGETIPRNHTTGESLQERIAKAKEIVASGSGTQRTFVEVATCEYAYSWGIRGDNSPEQAVQLGYLNGKELYPNFKSTTLRQFVQEVMTGKIERLYAGRYQ